MTEIICPQCRNVTHAGIIRVECVGNAKMWGIIQCLACQHEFPFTMFKNYMEKLDVALPGQQSDHLNPSVPTDLKDDVEEADNTFLAAINGFKGAGQAILLLLGFTSDSIDTTQALLLSTDVIPSWLQALIVIALITFVIFIVIDVVIGRKPITN